MFATTFSPIPTTMTRTAVPRPTPNECALHRLMCTPVCERMIRYLAYLTSEVVRCEGDQQLDNVVPPTTTTDSTRHIRRSVFEPPLPRLELFVDNVIKNSRVRVPTLITIPIYLSRLRQRLRPEDRGVKSTPHRIFLATLILASKNSNDAFLSNKQWAEWTTVGDFGFSLTEVNTMERELLFYLDWNLRITNVTHGLVAHLG